MTTNATSHSVPHASTPCAQTAGEVAAAGATRAEGGFDFARSSAVLARFARPDAVLFDLDGTLVDSVEDIFVAVNALMRELGLPERSRDEVATWVGNGARMLVERAMAGRFEGFSISKGLSASEGLPGSERGVDLDGVAGLKAFAGQRDARALHAAADAAMPRFRAIYHEICVDHTAPLAGSREALAAVHARGLGVAIVTNKPLAPTERIVDALGWRPFVSVILGGDSLSVRKPDPAPLVEALRRLGATNGWMVGDSANDVGAAKAAAMPSLVVRGGYNHGRPVESLDPAPEVILDSLEHFPALLAARLG